MGAGPARRQVEAAPETIAMLAAAGTPCVEKPFRLHQLMEAVEKTIGKP
jgi:succinyl-CoA synthetase alpha subunit